MNCAKYIYVLHIYCNTKIVNIYAEKKKISIVFVFFCKIKSLYCMEFCIFTISVTH